ncbi:MAG: phospholipase A, partial [Campylobacterota bacterium]|nr:phospholipase A [Campylobacterota bacterium]
MRNLFILFFLSSILSALQNSSTKENRNLISFPKDIETNTSMNRWLNSHFGLEPYKENYLLLLGYRKSSYKSYIPTDVYTNVESELQISLKLNVKNNILGLDEKYYLSYSHHSFWQIYSSSSPFRETIYNPEAFVIFPISDSSIFNLSSLKIAMAHRSNGQGDNRNIDTNITEVFDIE